MKLSSLFKFSALIGLVVSEQQQPYMVPVPWLVTSVNIYNTRHGSGGYWNLNITDTPTKAPQGFNTTCAYYNPTAYSFAIDGAPYSAPCMNPNVTFGLFPNGGCGFTLNVTHIYGDCSNKKGYPKPCVDNGTWIFSNDDVRGQQVDLENNFGQAGSFSDSGLKMYPTRAIPSEKCEFC